MQVRNNNKAHFPISSHRYEPVQRSWSSEPVPTVKPAYILMHGGGNSGGNSSFYAMQDSGNFFASRGFLALSINYRLKGDNGRCPSGPNKLDSSAPPLGWRPNWMSGYPAVRDLKAAIRYVRANAASLGVDEARIVISGGSAGATNSIAAGVVFEGDYKDELTAEQDPTLSTTNPEVSSSVACVVSHWASEGEIEFPREIDPKNRSRYGPQNAPIIEFHGDEDPTINISEAYKVRAAYAQTGVPYELHVLKGCEHAAWCYDGLGSCACSPRTPKANSTLDEMALPFVAKQLGLPLV